MSPDPNTNDPMPPGAPDPTGSTAQEVPPSKAIGDLEAAVQKKRAEIEAAQADSKGKMATTAASADPQPEDSHTPFPDVDQPLSAVSKEPWDNPQHMVESIESHVKNSHGLEPDKQLLKQIADWARRFFNVQPPEQN